MPIKPFLPQAVALAACLALSACSDPVPDPSPDPLPEPQAQAGATQLRDAMQAPVDKAREVEAGQAERDAERDQALEDAGG